MKIDLNKYEPKREQISVPEWTDEDIFVQEMLGEQLELIQKYTEVVKGKAVVKNQYAVLIVASVVDKDGNHIFTESDIEKLNKQPATLIARLMEAINRVSGVVVSTE